MPRAKYERTLQATSNGAVVVLSEGTAEFRTPGGDLIPLFDARENGSALGNPVTADSSGRVRVYFEPQRFRVRQRSSDSTIDETIVDEIALADGVPAVGTSPGNLVALEDDGDGNGALPAVDGSNLLNVVGGTQKIEVVTQTEYDALDPPDSDTLYFIEED